MRSFLLASALLLATTSLTIGQSDDAPVFRSHLTSPIFFASPTGQPSAVPNVRLPSVGVLRANASIEILPTLATALEGATWSTEPELPDFLRIDSQTGRISGTVPVSQDYGTFQVQATHQGRTGHADIRLIIAPESIRIGTIDSISTTEGLAIDAPIPFAAGDGTRTYEWVDVENAPAWLRFEGDRIKGTATVATLSGLRVKVTDATGESISEPFSVDVAAFSLPVFPAKLQQMTNTVTQSSIVEVSGGAGRTLQFSTSWSGAFRVCGNATCTQSGSWVNSATLGEGPQFLQMRLSMRSTPNTESDGTLTTGAASTQFIARTAPAVTMTRGTSASASRDGFSAKCGSWTGAVCNDIQIRPSSTSGWWEQSTSIASGTLPASTWYQSTWTGDGKAEAAFFCYIATGNPAVTSNVRGSGADNTGNLAQYAMGSNVSGPSWRRGALPAHSSTPVTLFGNNTHRLQNVQCTAWGS